MVFNGYEILVEGCDFDVILGMDWLSTHQASMDCFTKKVIFRKPGFPELEFEGDRRVLPICVISVLEAKRLLHKGCEAYLAHVDDTSTPNVSFKNVPVVQEFSNAFPEDLQGLSPNRELQFGIELLLGLASISIPLYRMALAKLKELKTKLQDFVDKGFIRASVSLWGDLV